MNDGIVMLLPGAQRLEDLARIEEILRERGGEQLVVDVDADTGLLCLAREDLGVPAAKPLVAPVATPPVVGATSQPSPPKTPKKASKPSRVVVCTGCDESFEAAPTGRLPTMCAPCRHAASAATDRARKAAHKATRKPAPKSEQPTKPDRYGCQFCDREFATKQDLGGHTSKKHPMTKSTFDPERTRARAMAAL